MTKTTLKRDGAKISVWLDGPDWDGIRAATVGDFSCKTSDAGRAILAEALHLIRAEGRDRVLGPMAGDTWHSYRFVSESDGSPPFLMEPASKPQETEALRAAGFRPVSRYFSARMSLSDIELTPPPPSGSFSVETWNGDDPEGLFRQVYDLSTKAFASNAFYTPISEDDFLATYVPMVPLIRRELIFFARRPGGDLAGFLFAIPNYAEGPTPETVILKTYASLERGAGRHLVHACNRAAGELGFGTMIHALIHDANQSAERSAAEGGKIFRRYELLGLKLDV